jgi:hypothetical protein
MQLKLYQGNWWLFLKGAGNYDAVGYYPTKNFKAGQLSKNAEVGLFTQLAPVGKWCSPVDWEDSDHLPGVNDLYPKGRKRCCWYLDQPFQGFKAMLGYRLYTFGEGWKLGIARPFRRLRQ